MLTNEEKIAVLKKVTNRISGGELYEGYSGRGMYGEQCYGISCDYADECIEEAAILGLRGASVDQLGKGYIVYWPSIKYG